MDRLGGGRKPRRPHRLLVRGESVIASTGLLLAALLLAFMGATGYWTLRVQREAVESAQLDEVRSLGVLLSEAVAVMLPLDQLSTTRRLLLEAGRNYDLTECRVVLADGHIVADIDPSNITLLELPPAWSGAAAGDATEASIDGTLRLGYPILVPGRGTARLEMVAAVKTRPWHYWEAQAGVGIIGAVALVGLLLVYRHVRARLMPLGFIREALLAMGSGEKTAAALTIREELGAEARAWNALVTERERAGKERLGEAIEEMVKSRGSGTSNLDGAIDALWYGVLLVDRDLQVTYSNGAAAVYLRVDRSKIVHAELGDVVADRKIVESVGNVFTASVRHRTAIELDNRGGDNGNEVLRFTIRAVGRDDPSMAIIVIEDVTQLRVAEESRNAFVTQVTHELRSPLTNIRLSAETAIEDGEAAPHVRAKCLNVINQEAKRLERVVSDMLSVAEIEAGTLTLRRDDVRLDALFEDIQADYAGMAAEKNITLEFNLPPKLPVIMADRDKLALVLHNLVNNAIKYTEQGGRVIVNVDLKLDALMVDVIDNGIGIGEDDIDKVFEKFYRAKDERVGEVTGSGLGLALAQQVIRLHGGEIWVESELSKGSTFSLKLPVAAKVA